MMSNICMKTEIFDKNLHLALGELTSFAWMGWISSWKISTR
jgi:hypothetical protein